MARYSLASILFGALFLLVSVVAVKQSAAAPTVGTCMAGDILITPAGGNADLTTSIACEYHSGNDNHINDIPNIDPFGITDWVLADKSDGPDGDHSMVLSGVVNGGNTGSWSVDSFDGYTDVLLTIKASNGFAAYLLDTNFLSGEWTTYNIFPSGGGGKGLSHMSLFYSPSSLTAVPLPAAFPLYAAGILVLGWLGFKRRKS